MGIGLGIILVVAGLILVLQVFNLDTPIVDEVTLGWILLVVGVLAIILALVVNQQRRSRVVETRRHDEPPRY